MAVRVLSDVVTYAAPAGFPALKTWIRSPDFQTTLREMSSAVRVCMASAMTERIEVPGFCGSGPNALSS